jgi:hypothetical protein
LKTEADHLADLFFITGGDIELELFEDFAHRGSPLGVLTCHHHLGGRWLRRCLLAHLCVT